MNACFPAFVLACALAANATAEHIVHGTIRDATTGEPLAAATVQIVGTYRATIANDEGQYALKVPALPATVRVVNIGYRSLELSVDPASSRLDFALEAVPYQLPETIVRPASGAELMQKVIDRKAEWMPRIRSYSAEVYTRRTVTRSGDIVEMYEVVSDVFWDRERGSREIVTSRRHTRNSRTDKFIPALSGMVNLYHDDVDFLASNLMGVTHPDALDHYEFTLSGQRRIDDRLVYDITVRPRGRLHSGFSGTVAILDGQFALLEAALEPARATLAEVESMPLVEDLAIAFHQQFRSFGGLWLPIDYRLECTVEVGTIGLQFPPIGLEQVTRFADYAVSAETAAQPPEVQIASAAPADARRDSLFASEQNLHVDSLAVATDTAFTRFADPVPLTVREAVALDTISTDFSRKEAFKPSGFMTRFIDFAEEEEGEVSVALDSEGGEVERDTGRKLLSGLEAAARFNRVEEAQAGLRHVRTVPGGITLSSEAGFSSGLRRWNFDLAAHRGWDLAPGWLSLHAGYGRGGGSHYPSDIHPLLLNSLQALLGEDDYFDYYWVDGVGVDLNWLPGHYDSKLRLGFRAEEHSSLANTTDFDVLDRRPLRPNPPVDEGRMRRLEAEIEIGGTPHRRFELSVEYSADWLGSDFGFTNAHFALDWHQPTFLRRRWIPNALDLRIVGGLHSGLLPVQRFGALDVGMGPLTPYGSLRAINGHPYIGESYLGVVAEHDFRSAPFELLGLWPLVERGFGLLVHGGYGETWISAARRRALPLIPRWTKEPHRELGLSLLLYGMARVDITQRIEPDESSVGVSMARIEFE